MPILLGSDNAVILEDLHDDWASSGAGEYISTGTVTAQLREPDGPTIGTGTTIGSPITMTYYTSRNGVAGHWWVGVIEEDVAVVIGLDVDVVVTATASSDRVRVFKERHRVMNG